jgi:hypothetical protein
MKQGETDEHGRPENHLNKNLNCKPTSDQTSYTLCQTNKPMYRLHPENSVSREFASSPLASRPRVDEVHGKTKTGVYWRESRLGVKISAWTSQEL